jgi:drug/metabolite transporter (DMT)-like permease
VNARWAGVLFLVITATGWALNWPAMRFLLREWPPLFSRGIAGVAAGLLLAIVAVRSGERLSVPREAYARLAFASFTNVFAWMGFGTLCMKWLKVGEGTLIVYSMPIWAMLLAWPILGTRPTLRGTCALVLALAGIAVLLSGQGFSFSMGELTGIGFALSASVLFALGTVLNRQPLPLPPIASTAWQVGLGCAPMIVLGLLFETVGPLSTTGWWLMAYMTLFPDGRLLSHLVRDPAPSAALDRGDRHVAGAADRRGVGSVPAGRTAGLARRGGDGADPGRRDPGYCP